MTQNRSGRHWFRVRTRIFLVSPFARPSPNGETTACPSVTGGISRAGDAMVRTALYEAANVMLTRTRRFSALERWGLEVARRHGVKRARVALARKLATVLHRMWADGSSFRFGKEVAAA